MAKNVVSNYNDKTRKKKRKFKNLVSNYKTDKKLENIGF